MIGKLRVKSPANIAIIKYMGKIEGRAANGSLSLTLNDFATDLALESLADPTAKGVHPNIYLQYKNSNGKLESPSAKFSQHAQNVLAHAPALLAEWKIRPDLTPRSIRIQTQNTFPADAGLASSASAFSALTTAILAAQSQSLAEFAAVFERSPAFRAQMGRLSARGSGSSTRSLLGPWVIWEEDRISEVPSSLPALTDIVAIVSEKKKSVSSSEAHLRVLTSPLFAGRADRVARSLERAANAVKNGDLKTLAEISWSEMWEMHSLFHTAQPSFTYLEPRTLEFLNWIAPFVHSASPGTNPPLVTLDAGPNVHVIVAMSDAMVWQARIRERFPDLKLLLDHQGKGTTLEN